MNHNTKSKTNVISIVILFSAFFLFVSCGQQKTEWKGTVEEENGITVVKNPKEPMYGEDAISLEEELSIGSTEEREEYMFGYTVSIAVNDNGDIYILDIQQKNIRVFDRDGKYLKTIGGRGQGPGEMEMPTQIQITSQNELASFDLRRRSLEYFSLDGKFLRRNPLIQVERPTRIIIDSNGDFICYMGIIEENQPKVALMKFNSDQEKEFVITKFDPFSMSADPFSPYKYRILRPGLLFDVAKENNILWAISSEYELKILNSKGKTTKKIVKDYVPVEITEDDKKEIIFNRYGTETPPADRNIVFPKYFYPISGNSTIGISTDEKGNILVRTYEKAPDSSGYYYDVFDPEGYYIAKVPLKADPDLPIIWKKNKLYTIEVDEEGYQTVKRYKVTWKY
ncbi:MAG: 6-bladed beta-propeller [Candidatus Aminicenantes bacterium]|nr:6-bladed beta-propeller [Candidatus Aminicenantes bacterium]